MARGNADAARIQRETEEEAVELTAIMLYLHLAGLELRGGRRVGRIFFPTLPPRRPDNDATRVSDTVEMLCGRR